MNEMETTRGIKSSQNYSLFLKGNLDPLHYLCTLTLRLQCRHQLKPINTLNTFTLRWYRPWMWSDKTWWRSSKRWKNSTSRPLFSDQTFTSLPCLLFISPAVYRAQMGGGYCCERECIDASDDLIEKLKGLEKVEGRQETLMEIGAGIYALAQMWVKKKTREQSIYHPDPLYLRRESNRNMKDHLEDAEVRELDWLVRPDSSTTTLDLGLNVHVELSLKEAMEYTEKRVQVLERWVLFQSLRKRRNTIEFDSRFFSHRLGTRID